MDNYEAIFDRAIRANKLGFRLDVDAIADPAQRTMFTNFRTMARDWIENWCQAKQIKAIGTMPPVHFDFIADPGLNAVAFASEGIDFIGINEGTVFLLSILFSRLLAFAEVCPTIGTPRLETERPLPLPLVTDLSELFESGVFLSVPPTVPKDPMRFAYSQELISLAFLQILAHEFGHLRYGHVAMLTQSFGHCILREVGEDEAGLLSPLTSQALEMDADSWSPVSMVSNMLVRHKTQSIDMKPDLFKLCFACSCLFALMDAVRPSIGALSLADYPPAAYRSAWISGVVWELIKRECGESVAEDILKTVIVPAQQAALFAIGLYKAEPFHPLHLGAAYTEEALAHLNSVSQQWATVVRPLLVPLSRASDLVR